jgi:deazaflavin-dependent oxidoreductase (nitroreductase family)
MPLDPTLARRPVCDLETIGRASGLPRCIEIWFAGDAEHDRIYVLSGGRDRAHWVRNIQQDSAVRVRIGEQWLTGRGRILGPGPEDLRARRLVAAKYEAWREGRSLSTWAATSLPVAVDLELTPA